MEILEGIKIIVRIGILIEALMLVTIEILLLINVIRKELKATDALIISTALMLVPTLSIALYVLIDKMTRGLI